MNQIEIKDIRIDIFRAPDQDLHHTSRGIRMTHKPTGCQVTKTDGILGVNKKLCLRALTLLVEGEKG